MFYLDRIVIGIYMKLNKILILLITILASNLLFAKPFSIERSEIITITSQDNLREYHLFIKTPRTYSSEKNRRYPLIFLNDGSYSFPLVSSITRQMSGGGVIEEPIIVGISYDKKTSWDISRTRDYTPTKSLNEKNRHSDESRKHSGGAGEYLLFIEKELMPFLRTKYRINPEKEIYAGNSFGGLFGGFILKTKPYIFDYYLLSDPSFWYHNGSIFNFKGNQPSATPIVLITSQNDQSEDLNNTCILCMAKNAKKFSESLKVNLPNARIEYLELDNEIHETMFPASASQALLRFLRKK